MEKNAVHSPLQLPTNHIGRIPKGDCLFNEGRKIGGKLSVLEEDVNMQIMHSKQPVPIEGSIASEGQEGEVGTCLKADLAVTGLPRFTREATYPRRQEELETNQTAVDSAVQTGYENEGGGFCNWDAACMPEQMQHILAHSHAAMLVEVVHPAHAASSFCFLLSECPAVLYDHLWVRNLCVNSCRLRRGVTQPFLQRQFPHASLEHACRMCVPQSMWRHPGRADVQALTMPRKELDQSMLP